MRFRITASSGLPCEEAVPDPGERVFHRWTIYHKTAPTLNPQRNLQEDAFGYSYERLSWHVDIPDLQSLVSFIEKHGEIVMDKESIEIYDDYRE